MVYAERVVPPSFVRLRVPLRSWLRCRIARMNSKIVRNALLVREKNEAKIYSEAADNENENEQLVRRIDGIETTLKAMQATLNAICDKLNKS